MAVIVTDNRTTRNEADANTGWTGTTTVVTTNPDPVEVTGSVGANVGIAVFDGYHTGGAVSLTNAVVYVWVYIRPVPGNTTDANGGVMVHLGDGTNRVAYKVAGADIAGFRHDAGPTQWQNIAADTQNLPAGPLLRAGSIAGLNFAAITQMGFTVNSLSPAPGMDPTVFVDIIRYLLPATNDGCALTVTGGTSGGPGTFLEVATEDRSTANLKAHGIIRELGTGVFGVQGPLRFGNPTGTASSWFEDKNTTMIFESRGFRNTLYKVFITDNGVGTTTFKLGDKTGTGIDARGSNGCALIAPPGVGAEFDAFTDADVTDVFLYGSRIVGFTNGIKLRQNQEMIDCNISGSGLIEPNGATLVNTVVSATTDTVKALNWNIALDTLTRLDGMSFSGPVHAIEFGSSTPSTLTFNSITFTGYGTAETTTSAIYNNSGKAITINITGGGSTPTVRNGTGASTVVNNAVSLAILCTNESGLPILGVRVRIETAVGGTLIAEGQTDGNGEFEDFYNFGGDLAVRVVARLKGYKFNAAVGTITAVGISVPFTMIRDEAVNLP